MEETRKETAQGLRNFFGRDFRLMIATVQKVSGYICTVQHEDVEMDVRLKATDDDAADGLIITPKVGSNVLIAPIENSNYYYVIAVDEVEKIEYKAGQTLIKASATELEIKTGGKLKLLNNAQNFTSLIDDLFDLLEGFKVMDTTPAGVIPSVSEPITVGKVQVLKGKFKTLLG
jgi:hypothetical protein